MMHVQTAAASPFFNELVSRLRRVRLDALPAVVAALDANGAPSHTTPSIVSVPPGDADALAQQILALPAKGSKLDAIQRAVITHALTVSKGNVSAAARLLGVDRKALERKLARYKLKR